MKIHLTLTGSFYRTPIGRSTQEPINLNTWIHSYQTVAAGVRVKSPQLLRQKFGLEFLSEHILVQILQPLPLPVETEIESPTFYDYRFVNSEADIVLQPDDPQIPFHWKLGETSQSGVYEITCEYDRYPGLSEIWLDSIWQKVKQQWESYSDCEKIKMALQSSKSGVFDFRLRDRPEVKVEVDNSELPMDVREAIAYLRQSQNDISHLSASSQTLIKQYQENYSVSSTYFELPKNLAIELSPNSPHTFILGRKQSRKEIENLVNQAENFLLLSSYIIEDRNITELICQKAVTLPQGVWILTSLRDEVIDRLDTQVDKDYQRTDEKKARCLTMLLDAGVHIRSGAFHLKAYISEKAAYLGSCNLTGGSLDFNLEAGLICQKNPTHQDLIKFFRHCWQYKAGYNVIPSSIGGSFICRSLEHVSPDSGFKSDNFFTSFQYIKDLKKELQLSQFRDKVEIYSRDLSCDAELTSLLKNCSTCIYSEACNRSKYPFTFKNSLDKLHAKVTLLGDRVAYLGGVNFRFGVQDSNLIDLMYKTSDREEIKKIRKQLGEFK